MTNDFGGGRLSRTPFEGVGFPPIFFEDLKPTEVGFVCVEAVSNRPFNCASLHLSQLI
ncbi:MAG: hypothetical protein HWQ38_17290 [Nostoc sp. NMS7]|uniref:hypothetical protein n=1 Tax=Nostoc sp. NMS7 TaxID=2815391 RepID=UPI0025CFEB81|nr:hypothetical protein [Nostoc sp. NMS7]MBN3948111.1 hypothetical protein [Nostoc sp. NMS7]